jgi:hypothetical protein
MVYYTPLSNKYENYKLAGLLSKGPKTTDGLGNTVLDTLLSTAEIVGSARKSQDAEGKNE